MKLFRTILILALTVCASAAFAQGYITNQNVKYLSVTGWEKLTNLNASTVPYLDANQVLQSSSVTPTQLGFLSTISGAILTNNNTWTVTNKTLDAGSNTLTNISAAYIQGVSVSTTSPTDAQVLLYNSTLSKWAPVSVSGDATIASSGVASVGKIQGNAVLSGAPSAGQALIWNSTGSRWDWETLPISGGGTGQTTQTAAFDALSPLTSAGDLLTFGTGHNQRLGTSIGDLGCFLQSGGAIVSNSYTCNGASLTNVNAIKLQSVAVASTSPTGGQFLSYNGTAWAPFSFSSGDLNVSAAGVVTVQGLQGVSVKSGTPASGQVLTYNGTSTKWDAETPSASSFTAPTVQKFTSTGTQTGWLFTISTSSTVAVGDTYTNNSNTYTVQGALSAQSGQVLFMSGTGATSGTTLTRASGSGTSSITFSAKIATATYTTPTGPIYLRIRVLGGGGGGGGSGTGSPASGTAGNNSWFGANLILANGGSAGTAAGAGGTGGSATITTITQLLAVTGNSGQNPDATSTTLNAFGGDGGGSSFGGAGRGGGAGSGGSDAAANSGAGGGGSGGAATSYAASGGGGAGGYAEAFISSPGTSYPYIVGASASGGSGTSGTAGAGGAGIIIIEEHYQ